MKILISIIPLLGNVVSICFNTFAIKNLGLMSFKNKVYNLSNYNDHPGGFGTLSVTKGKDVSLFFEMEKYKFHILSSREKTQSDLDKIYIGNVCNPVLIAEKSIYNTSSFWFPMITLSLFLINSIIVRFCDEKEYKYRGTYISLKVLISCIFYTIWWLSLGLMSLFLEKVINDTGIWITLCLMFGLLPMTRNSIWIILFKASYRKLIIIHKFISILTNIAALIKLVVVIYYVEPTFLISNVKAVMGIIGTFLIWTMSILALPIIRERYFELFLYSHKFLLICLVITTALHSVLCFYIILPSLTLYLTDLFLRFINTYKILYAKVQTFEFQDDNKTKYNFLTIVTNRSLKSIDAGSFFFICNKKISKYEFHPISLIKQKENILLFCIKDLGHNCWSSKFEDNETNEIYIQGPYAYIDRGYRNNKYKTIILICNGVGITPIINIFYEVQSLSFKKVVFIWIVPHPSFIEPFTDIFTIIQQNIKIELKIFVTKSPQYGEIYSDRYNIIFSKPSIESEVLNYTCNHKEICILCSGSRNLLKDVKIACEKLNIDLYSFGE